MPSPFTNKPINLNSSQLTEQDILFEDNHLIVISKPAGIATMGTSEDDASLYKLTKQFLKIKYDKPGNVYLGVVSRIDSFVSGVIVFAKTSKAASRLSDQFRAKSVSKKYIAVLEGMLESKAGHLKSWLRKNDRLRRVESFSREVDGSKFGELRFNVLRKSDKFSLVEVELITGRKHQIRAQFADLGMPIFGDRKYDGKKNFGNAIALHARHITITHPTKNDRMDFEASIPEQWRKNRQISPLILSF